MTTTTAVGKIADLCHTIADRDEASPGCGMGLGFLSTDPARSIAPGFTITPAEAEKLEEERAARPATAAPATTPAPKL